MYGLNFTVFQISSSQHSTRFTIMSYSTQHRRPRRLVPVTQPNPDLFRSVPQRELTCRSTAFEIVYLYISDNRLCFRGSRARAVKFLHLRSATSTALARPVYADQVCSYSPTALGDEKKCPRRHTCEQLDFNVRTTTCVRRSAYTKATFWKIRSSPFSFLKDILPD